MGPKLQFLKSVSDHFFHSQNMFHISRWLKPKNRPKFFQTNFSNFFTSYCLPMGPKFQFLTNMFPTIFFTYKTCFTTFHVDRSQKLDKNFFEPCFQNFLQVIVPLWDQNFNFWKAVSDNFFHLQNMFHNISRWSKPKTWQKLFRTMFSKFFTSYCPPMGPKFQFLKSCFRQFFSLTKHVSQHFTLIEAKNLTKTFSNHVFKIFYKLLSPYGTKTSIFEKSVSDHFFHSQNMFHISRWLKSKNRPKFLSNQFFKIFYKLLSPYGTKISIFEKTVSDHFFHSQNMFHISRWLK